MADQENMWLQSGVGTASSSKSLNGQNVYFPLSLVVGPAYRCRIGANTDVLDDSVLAGLYFRQEVNHCAGLAADRQPCSVSSKAHLDDDVVGKHPTIIMTKLQPSILLVLFLVLPPRQEQCLDGTSILSEKNLRNKCLTCLVCIGSMCKYSRQSL